MAHKYKEDSSLIKYLRISEFRELPSLVFLNFFKDNKIFITNKTESHNGVDSILMYQVKYRGTSGQIRIKVSQDFLITINMRYGKEKNILKTRIPEEALYYLKTVILT